MEKFKKVAVVSLFFLFLVGFFLFHLLLPDQQFSAAERKPLAQAPILSSDTVLSGDYFTEAEAYLLEQFPLRTAFLNCKRILDKNIFLMSSSGGYANAGDHLTKLDKSLDEYQINHAIKLLNLILSLHPEIRQAHYAIVPDKNYYLSQITSQPTLDYDTLYGLMEGLNAQEIDLRSILTLDDYYRTDSHWRQERILPVAEAICEALGVPTGDSDDYSVTSLENFKGVYYELTESPPEPDTLVYLSNEAMENATVQYLDNTMKWRTGSVYVPEHFGKENTDSYDVFLDGPESLITIENPAAKTDRHLILFRDSYGSSLAPLLVDSYAKITLIDLRYMNWYYIKQMDIDYTNADVLLLYSTTFLNSAVSAGMK